MNPPLPGYLPSNLSPDEIIAALSPCFEPSVLRALEDAFRGEATDEAARIDDCKLEEIEQELKDAKAISAERREVLEVMVEHWKTMQEPVPWNDRKRWDNAVAGMRACSLRARAEGLL